MCFLWCAGLTDMESLNSFVNETVASAPIARRKSEQLERKSWDLEKDEEGSKRRVYNKWVSYLRD